VVAAWEGVDDAVDNGGDIEYALEELSTAEVEATAVLVRLALEKPGSDVVAEVLRLPGVQRAIARRDAGGCAEAIAEQRRLDAGRS